MDKDLAPNRNGNSVLITRLLLPASPMAILKRPSLVELLPQEFSIVLQTCTKCTFKKSVPLNPLVVYQVPALDMLSC